MTNTSIPIIIAQRMRLAETELLRLLRESEPLSTEITATVSTIHTADATEARTACRRIAGRLRYSASTKSGPTSGSSSPEAYDVFEISRASLSVICAMGGKSKVRTPALRLFPEEVNRQGHWVRWHGEYGDERSSLSRRLAVVQRRLRQALDDAPAGRVRTMSMCAGQGRDVLGVLVDHPRALDVTARRQDGACDGRSCSATRPDSVRCAASG